MVKGKIVRAASLAVTSAGLLAVMPFGIAGASAGTITTTGYQSYNAVVSKNTSSVHSNNHTNLLIGSASVQGSASGSAYASKNTTGGNVATGNSSNNNSTMTDVSVTTPTPVMPMSMGVGAGDNTGTIGTTGADSVNKVVSVNSSDVHTNTTTNIANLSFSAQESSTGNADASKNTTVGNVTTGNSSNTNTTTTTITVQ